MGLFFSEFTYPDRLSAISNVESQRDYAEYAKFAFKHFNMSTVLTIAAVVVILFFLFKIFKLITRLALIAVFLVLAYLTNPSEEKHRNAVREKNFGEGKIFHPRVKVKDLWVASLTQIADDDGGVKTIGIGLFTKVFVFRSPEK